MYEVHEYRALDSRGRMWDRAWQKRILLRAAYSELSRSKTPTRLYVVDVPAARVICRIWRHGGIPRLSEDVDPAIPERPPRVPTSQPLKDAHGPVAVTKNDEVAWLGNDLGVWLRRFEWRARLEPGEWRVTFCSPLEALVYERTGRDLWELTKFRRPSVGTTTVYFDPKEV